MKYKTFRTALGAVFVAFNQDVEMYQKNQTGLIPNVPLVETRVIVALYPKFYNLDKKRGSNMTHPCLIFGNRPFRFC